MRPSDVKRPGCAAAPPGRKDDSPGGRINGKPTDDPRQFQGIANARCATRPAPTWSMPAEADALDELERAWGRVVPFANRAAS